MSGSYLEKMTQKKKWERKIEKDKGEKNKK